LESIAARERVLDRVRAILVDKLRVERAPSEIDPDVALFGTGLGLDSVDAVELLVCLETELGLKIPDASVARPAMRTVNTLVDMVLAAKEGAR
jgi:acyl carrier protein